MRLIASSGPLTLSVMTDGFTGHSQQESGGADVSVAVSTVQHVVSGIVRGRTNNVKHHWCPVTISRCTFAPLRMLTAFAPTPSEQTNTDADPV